MKHYLLVHNRKEGDAGALPVSGTVHDVSSAEDAIAFLESGELLSAVILDTPSEIPGVSRLISSVNDRNSDLLAFPILILTDEAHIGADEQYLGGVVVDCVMKPLRPGILKNRLANAEQLVSSVSFTEFSQMLRSLGQYLSEGQSRPLRLFFPDVASPEHGKRSGMDHPRENGPGRPQRQGKRQEGT